MPDSITTAAQLSSALDACQGGEVLHVSADLGQVTIANRTYPKAVTLDFVEGGGFSMPQDRSLPGWSGAWNSALMLLSVDGLVFRNPICRAFKYPNPQANEPGGQSKWNRIGGALGAENAKNIVLDGGYYGGGGEGIGGDTLVGWVIQNTRIDDTGAFGIQIGARSDDVLVTGNRITGFDINIARLEHSDAIMFFSGPPWDEASFYATICPKNVKIIDNLCAGVGPNQPQGVFIRDAGGDWLKNLDAYLAANPSEVAKFGKMPRTQDNPFGDVTIQKNVILNCMWGFISFENVAGKLDISDNYLGLFEINEAMYPGDPRASPQGAVWQARIIGDKMPEVIQGNQATTYGLPGMGYDGCPPGNIINKAITIEEYHAKIAEWDAAHPASAIPMPTPNVDGLPAPAPSPSPTPAPTPAPAPQPTPNPTPAPTTITTADALTKALTATTGGETITLGAGNFGTVQINNRRFTSTVTITGPADAHIDGFNIDSSSNISIIGIDLGHDLKPGDPDYTQLNVITNSSMITFNRIHLHGSLDDNPQNDGWGINATNVTGFQFTNSVAEQHARALLLALCSDIVVTGNKFTGIRSDAIDMSACERVQIEENDFRDFHPITDDHPDAIQMWNKDQPKGSTDITIRRNVIFTAPGGKGPQGIFISDGEQHRYQNVTIEDNLIYTDQWEAIMVSQCDGLTIQRNTVMSPSGIASKARIRTYDVTAARVTDNVAADMGFELSPGLVDEGNVVLTRDPDKAALIPNRDTPTSPADLIIPGVGYQLVGTPTPTPVPLPTPQPAPAPAPQPKPTPAPSATHSYPTLWQIYHELKNPSTGPNQAYTFGPSEKFPLMTKFIKELDDILHLSLQK